MLGIIKNKIWNLLKEKEVSLAMLYDKKGKILWNKGRKTIGATIGEGEGFSRTYALQALETHEPVRAEAEPGLLSGLCLTESMAQWNIKSLLILPVADDYFLYVDSGTKQAFTASDYERFVTLGELLGDTIDMIRTNETGAGGITGNSDMIRTLRNRVLEYAIIDEPILLKGETGTGKSHIAELVHSYSGKPGKFKVIHTPGIPQTLFESEMFGHVKGAFTDARADRKGLIREAEGGTLFIDEVTDVPISIQAKLLRFVETKKYTVLGESGERFADVRIVAATNKNIDKAIENMDFREDLYYRLNVLELELPPLRNRKEDIKELVMEKINHLRGRKIGNRFWEALFQHDWPGNTRELITVLKRAGVSAKDTIEGTDIRDIIRMSPRAGTAPSTGGKLDVIWRNLASGQTFWEAVKKPYLDRELNREEVKEVLERGLRETNGVYKALLERFNLPRSEYKNFMRFLYENRLK